jgi:hypothetical protein
MTIRFILVSVAKSGTAGNVQFRGRTGLRLTSSQSTGACGAQNVKTGTPTTEKENSSPRTRSVQTVGIRTGTVL